MAGLEIEGYDDIDMIGRGGFATVYAATQARFGRRVALKVLDVSLDDNGRRRFERECLATGSLSHHPNVVTIYDAGETADGRPYLALEHLPGGSLQARLAATGPLDPGDAIDIGAVLADALVAAHDAGILHRDIKPANVLLTADGTPKIADFGISRLTGDPRYAGASTTSYSPVHVAPEQLANPDADPAADVYSLASTLFALIEGRPPHATTDSDTLHQLITRKVTGEPPIWGDRIHEPLKSTLAAALDPDPTKRPSMAVLAGQLHALASSDDHTIARTTRRTTPTEVPAPAPTPPRAPVRSSNDEDTTTPDTIIRTTPATTSAATAEDPTILRDDRAAAATPTPDQADDRSIDAVEAVASVVGSASASTQERPDEAGEGPAKSRRYAVVAIVFALAIGAPLALTMLVDNSDDADDGSAPADATQNPVEVDPVDVDATEFDPVADPSIDLSETCQVLSEMTMRYPSGWQTGGSGTSTDALSVEIPCGYLTPPGVEVPSPQGEVTVLLSDDVETLLATAPDTPPGSTTYSLTTIEGTIDGHRALRWIECVDAASPDPQCGTGWVVDVNQGGGINVSTYAEDLLPTLEAMVSSIEFSD